MNKSYSLIIIFLTLLVFSSCQSMEQLSIDYMIPAEVNFPAQLRKVAIVNNTSTVPDNKLLPETNKIDENSNVKKRAVAYTNGNARIATETLAKEIANQNYFDEVIICDSALRAHDILTRENTLSQEEVRQLTSDLGVDFLISLENLQFKVTKSVNLLPNYNIYQGTVDIKAYPTINLYIPGRNTPMATLHLQDSIFWEEYANSVNSVIMRLKPEKEMLDEASEFSGIFPVQQLLPYWTTEARYIYTNGSVNMRDAMIHVRNNSWDEAYKLWEQVYNSSKKDKKKMQSAFNIALYYEMKDSLTEAENWATKAQLLAQKIDKIETISEDSNVNLENIPNYYITTVYLSTLKLRNTQMHKLKMQMSRFNDNF